MYDLLHLASLPDSGLIVPPMSVAIWKQVLTLCLQMWTDTTRMTETSETQGKRYPVGVSLIPSETLGARAANRLAFKQDI